MSTRVLADGHYPRPPVVLIRCAGVVVVAASFWYVPWLLSSLNRSAPWLAWPFAGANVLLVVTALVTCANNWFRAVPARLRVVDGCPTVAVIVPTAGEPVDMVRRTLLSVLDSSWPHHALIVAVGDDAANPLVRRMVEELSAGASGVTWLYYLPPPRGDAARRGEAKAGNLNAGLDALAARGFAPEFVETRDADDLVGDPDFLRAVLGHLLSDPSVAYVQTIKEAHVGTGDPFGNTDQLFYRGAMSARHAANSVFPCGSGLVWRAAALADIGGFPGWNLVEDLQSGVEALRRGWRGAHVPVVGAVGQTAPEDLANVVKQRGTWALDTVRLLVWGELSGLSWRQRLQFLELGLFYLQGVATSLFVLTPVLGLLFEVYPLTTDQAGYAVHFWPVVLALELMILGLGAGHRFEVVFRTRQMWLVLAPVYVVAVVRALRHGPRRKPTYRVTRKNHVHTWYWRLALPQTVAVALLAGSVAWAVATRSLLTRVDLGSAYWAILLLAVLVPFVPRSWYGCSPRAALARQARRARRARPLRPARRAGRMQPGPGATPALPPGRRHRTRASHRPIPVRDRPR